LGGFRFSVLITGSFLSPHYPSRSSRNATPVGGIIGLVSDDRLASERRFFDEEYRNERPALNGFYELSGVRRDYAVRILADCAGRDVLEYGCGTGSYAFDLAARGATVIGIDISHTAIEVARGESEGQGNPHFQIGNAEALEFPDASFDLVCGTSIIHHLDVNVALAELKRVLRPGGRAVFYEPVAYNPAVNLYRWLTPQLHTPDEHPLTRADLARMSSSFRRAEFRFADLFALGAIPFLRFPGGGVLLRIGETLDRVAMVVPGLRWWGAVVVIELHA
jgi:SAM-dependent methyltransferase